MAVEITDSCDRCGRSESLHITHDELIERTQRIKAAEETAARISAAVREIWAESADHFPEVVTIHRIGNKLTIQDKISLCGPDTTRTRGGQGCESRVSKLVDEIHLDKSKKE